MKNAQKELLAVQLNYAFGIHLRDVHIVPDKDISPAYCALYAGHYTDPHSLSFGLVCAELIENRDFILRNGITARQFFEQVTMQKATSSSPAAATDITIQFVMEAGFKQFHQSLLRHLPPRLADAATAEKANTVIEELNTLNSFLYKHQKASSQKNESNVTSVTASPTGSFVSRAVRTNISPTPSGLQP